MKTLKVLASVSLIGIAIFAISYFWPPDAPPEDNLGYFLVDGERGKPLEIKLRNSSQPIMRGEGKRLASLNETSNELIYVDPAGREWVVPKGTINDGASVPPLLESWIPGGLNTNARYAAIVHDHFCDEMTRVGREPEGGYPAVHLMFFHAMLCSNVDRRTAGLMYLAVNKFGPPQDRTLWARLITRSHSEAVASLSRDESNSINLWIAEGTSSKTKELSSELDSKMQDLSLVEKTAANLESEIGNLTNGLATTQSQGGGIDPEALEILEKLREKREEIEAKEESLNGSISALRISLEEVAIQEDEANQVASQNIQVIESWIEQLNETPEDEITAKMLKDIQD